MTGSQIGTTPRRAVVFTPMETRRHVLVEAAVRAEELGYEAVIIPEGWALDAPVVLAEIAQRTERITLVAGILSVWSRSPAAIAMAAATLCDLSDGRFALGLGASTGALAEGLHDVAFDSPATKLRNTVGEVRALLAGDRASSHYVDRGLRLGRLPDQPPPIWVAGLGPQARHTAVALGDAWLPAMVPRSVLSTLRADSVAADTCQVVSCVMAAVDHDSESGRRGAEQVVGWYLTGMGPFYGDFAAANGFNDAVAAVRAANPRPSPGSIVWPSRADDLLDELAVFGEPDEVAAGFAAWDRLSDVVAVGVGPGSERSISALIEAGAPDRSSSRTTTSTTATP